MPGPLDNLEEAIRELQDMYDDPDIVTTADKIDRPERALDKQAIDDFMKRNPMAGGGMLVKPSFGDMREGFKKDYDVKELDKATEYYTKGEFKKYIKEQNIEPGRLYLHDSVKWHDVLAHKDDVYQFFIAVDPKCPMIDFLL